MNKEVLIYDRYYFFILLASSGLLTPNLTPNYGTKREPASLSSMSDQKLSIIPQRPLKLVWEDHFSPLTPEKRNDPCYSFILRKPKCLYQYQTKNCEGPIHQLEGLNTCRWRIMAHWNYWNKNYTEEGFNPNIDPGQIFSPQNIKIEEGKLILTGTQNPAYQSQQHFCGPHLPGSWSNVGQNCPFSSGGLEAAPDTNNGITGFHQTEGRFEARMRFAIYNSPYERNFYCSPAISTWPTFWFLPVWGTGQGLYRHNGWPLNGEIDVVDYLYSPDWNTLMMPRETSLPYGLISGDAQGLSKPTNKIFGIGVYDQFKPTARVNCENHRPAMGPWHDYAVEWKANQFLKIYKDHQLLMQVAQGERVLSKDGVIRPIQIPVGSMYPILELTIPHWAQARDVEGNKNRMEIDFIKYYRFCEPGELGCSRPTRDENIRRCPNKGHESGNGNCAVTYFLPPKLQLNVSYWIDKNPRWPGLYYKQVGSRCPFEGAKSGPNCKVTELPNLKSQVNYFIKRTYPNPGVYYQTQSSHCQFGGNKFGNTCLVKEISHGATPVLFGGVQYQILKNQLGKWQITYQKNSNVCPLGGTALSSTQCKVLEIQDLELMDNEMKYWVDPDPRWPGIYYRPNF